MMAKRQLSAIMFTDLAGYTAIMQDDEINAKGLRDRHRKILEKEIAEHDGQVLQYYGDGALSVFNSTISATTSAVNIQKASITSKIPLRIGIHSGDVVIEEDGVYGDGVNIASRIESFATTGSVMISDKVFDDIKNHSAFKPSLMGEFELKNVKRPVEIYALTNDGLVVPSRSDLKGKVKERVKSIVVLPFVNRSPDPNTEYICDGLTEELITELTHLEGLKVVSRASSFSLKGKHLDVRAIGKELEVQSVLEGSIKKSGNRIRINAQLSSTSDGYELWTERFDRELVDTFDLQDEVAQTITNELSEKFSFDEHAEIRSEPTVSLEAYNYYLQGQFYYNKWTPGDAKLAEKAFLKALELEPLYDQAYGGLARAYSLLAVTRYLPPKEGFQKTVDTANKVLELNPENEDGYVALAFADFFFYWNFERGRNHLEKALEINPRSSEANVTYGLYYLIKGKVKSAITYIQKAREIDPLSLTNNRTLADSYYLMGDYKMSIAIYDWLLEQDPDFKVALDFKGWAYLMLKDYEKAISIFESFLSEDSVHALKPYAQLGYAYGLKGDLKMAEVYLKKLQVDAGNEEDKSFHMSFAILYTGMGRKKEAIDFLERCVTDKIGAVIFLHLSPIWRPIRSEPRFSQLLDTVGLQLVENPET
ncbi:MAG: adenylate/guanylate cyclase domain-containing protein [Cytophagales bacterium]|nr:adenylate/guanylate cyclase domain-containing protein [Cytophagales bacterium]